MKIFDRHNKAYFKNEKKLARYGRTQIQQKYMRRLKDSLHDFNDLPVRDSLIAEYHIYER